MTSYADAPATTWWPGPALPPAVRAAARRIGRHRRWISWVLWLALGSLAIYLLLPQASALRDAFGALAGVHAGWTGLAVGFVGLRYLMAAVSLQLSADRPIPLLPTLLVQVATSFIGRLTPEGIGWLVLNQRYLERAGLPRSAAMAAIARKLIAGGIARAAIMVAVAAGVGASGIVPLDLPAPASVTAGLVALTAIAAIAALARAALRRAETGRLAALAAGAREVAVVFRQPRRAAALLGTSALSTVSYALALTASLLAVGAEASPVAVLAVYLGATAVASVSPTPGNVGAVEVTLSAGLAAVGVPAGAAVGGVVIYRLLTFWLPLLPGFAAFRYLQQRDWL